MKFSGIPNFFILCAFVDCCERHYRVVRACEVLQIVMKIYGEEHAINS
jgi:hypothetical protein